MIGFRIIFFPWKRKSDVIDPVHSIKMVMQHKHACLQKQQARRESKLCRVCLWAVFMNTIDWHCLSPLLNTHASTCTCLIIDKQDIGIAEIVFTPYFIGKIITTILYLWLMCHYVWKGKMIKCNVFYQKHSEVTLGKESWLLKISVKRVLCSLDHLTCLFNYWMCHCTPFPPCLTSFSSIGSLTSLSGAIQSFVIDPGFLRM